MKNQVIYCLFLANFIVILCTKADISPDKGCHKIPENLEPYLGSKTPYRFVANLSDKIIKFDGCHLEKIIGFIRHGTRTASNKIHNMMRHHLPTLRDQIVKAISQSPSSDGLLCKKVVKELSEWEFKERDIKGEKWLTHEGEDEMVDLAERFQKRFPSILTQEYSNSTYYFKHTASQRAEQSARYFATGLFGRYKSDRVQYPESLPKDPILRFYKLCDKWLKTVKKNPRAMIQHFEFTIGNEMLKTCEEITRRLGLKNTLPVDDVLLMYKTCAFETSWNKTHSSPWCSVFSDDDLEILNYSEDLKLYLRDGYGYDLNHQIACPAIQHIFKYFESDEKSNASAVFYFTHSGTILKLLSHLGLYKDSFQLTDTLTKQQRDDRKFKTSYIDAFASNILFASYMCGNERKILTLHQERPVQIPGCPDNQLCPFSTIQNNFNYTINYCDFDKLCSLSS